MLSSEDSADDEFVFVTKTTAGAGVAYQDSPGTTTPITRHPRPHHRLNQPIPITLDLVTMPATPVPRTWPASCSATATRAKVTPLPPELIELLPPHLRENTVPDYSTSTTPAEESLPERPPLPTTYCPGDYSNLDDPSTPTTPHNYDYLSHIITPDALGPLTSTHAIRSASLSRATVRNTCTPNSSHTAPAALALTDSGISSGGSSNSSRSNSSRSLPREVSRICNSGRPLQPPSPKFTRTATSSTASSTSTTQPQTRVSYTAVLASDGERASMIRRLEALTPTHTPLLSNFRAANSHNIGAFQADLSNIEERPHTRHVATAHTTVAPVDQPKPSPVANLVPSSVSWTTPTLEGGVGYSFPDPPTTTQPTPSAHPPFPPAPVSTCAHVHTQRASTRPSQTWAASPPSSPQMRRAWNVIGVPVREIRHKGSPSPGSRSPSPAPHSPSPAARSPSPAGRSSSPIEMSQRGLHCGGFHSDSDNIYDNVVVRHPPLAAATVRTAPTASVPPTFTPHPHPTTPPRRVPCSSLTGKPPSPPTQRRASRSPTPQTGWKPAGRPSSPHCLPYYHTPDPHYGGCWVPMWGSSPQLFQPGAGPMYPAYVYSGPTGEMCEGRSHSCDRIPARPSPPPSPRNGRRSASPWRGGSASPIGQVQAPSADCGSGRPPRPRRPPHRRSKTVEVGCLGVLAHPPSSGAMPAVVLADSTQISPHAIAYLPSSPTSRGPPPNQLYMQGFGHQNVPTCHTHTQPRQQCVPHIGTIAEQSGRLGVEACSSRKGTPSPSMMTSLYSPPSLPVPSPVFDRQAHAGSSKHKGSSVEERVSRLEGDKESLQLQVTVLSEQVEAQTEKIADLESLLQQKKDQLHKSEEQLQKEAMARSSLETQCLELVSEISNLKLRQAAYERENIDLREKIRRSDHQSDHAKAQLAAQLTNSPSPSSISTLSTIPASSPTKSPAQPTTASPASSPVASHDTREFMPPRTPPPNARRKIDQFGTVPRQREAGVCGENNHGAPSSGRSKGVMFGKGFHFLPFRVAGKRSTSAPNLAETEMQMIDDLSEGDYYPQVDGVVQSASSSPRCNTLTGHRSPPTHPKATGIKKIFTRLRRSSSGHLDSDLGEGDFRRGGMRATASARLGWTSPTTSFKEPNEAFTGWSIETIEAWFGALGLSQYCSGVRAWSSSGHHLSRATQQQLERELGIRHPLHRKKLQLAIAARLSGDQINTPLARLDHSWVLRWLDDVGLPQYKDSFSEARIDGRVLNCLTYDDLSFLRLSNLLHVTSLKRGIQVLREHNFDPSVLKRRSVPDEGQRIRTAAEVALWTNHRVMEWLRTVDLSEYAPNLRGSGVHGALMVYEVRFTSELLASLLSIPCGKTLLRRHLNTHFKELVGRSVVQEKRELEAASGYTPLTTSAKVKMPKKSQFSLKRKKSKSDLEFDDLLCPLDEKPPVGALQDKDKERLQRASAPPVIGRITKV
nr:nascent polypeptide-associated complex subunit alpha, muscle-specific form-like isoform X8 [Procambarus clarkii]